MFEAFEVHPGSGGESIEFGREPHWTQIRWLHEPTARVRALWSTCIHARTLVEWTSLARDSLLYWVYPVGWNYRETGLGNGFFKILRVFLLFPLDFILQYCIGSFEGNRWNQSCTCRACNRWQEWWIQSWIWDSTTRQWRLWPRSPVTVALPLTATDALCRCIRTLSLALRSTTSRSTWRRAKEKRGVKQENGLEGSEHSCFFF